MIFVLIGVCGCGKTTVGMALSKRLGCVFRDADEFHSKANKAKMSQGIPLTDEDRYPWLQAIHAFIRQRTEAGETAVVTCSALKRVYRQILVSGEANPDSPSKGHNSDVMFVLLSGSEAVIQRRLESRTGHFMPASLLPSQLATLEAPDSTENCLVVDVAQSVEEVVESILTRCD